MKEEIKYTDEWLLLEKGKNYLRLKNIYSDNDICHRYYNGDQCRDLKLTSIEPIVYNVIKPIVKYKIGVINSNGYDIVFSANNYDMPEFQKEVDALCKKINKYISKCNEISKIHKKIRKIIKKAAITSEGIIYFTYDIEKNEIKAEIVDKTNIFYGNENEDETQEQPYMLLTFRRDVDTIREIARKNNVSEEEIMNIVGDNETQEQSGDYAKDELNNMVECVLKLYKKDGKVYSKRSTSSVVYESEQPTGLTYYPVVHYVWEDEEGSARGVGEVKPNIPNQKEINKTAMRRALSVKMCAYAKLAYAEDKISNPNTITQVGTPIKVKDMNATDDIRKVVGYVQPATMSSDSKELQVELMTNTQELAGAGDGATGKINPEDASGKAILAVQQATQMPLTEQTERIKDLYEEVGLIMFDMWQVYTPDEGKQILVEQTDEQGQVMEVAETIPKSIIERMKVNVKVDVTPKTPYDRLAQELSLENLLTKGYIKFEEYVQALPQDSTMPKPILEKIIKAREEIKKKIMMQQQIVNQQNALMEQRLQQDMQVANQYNDAVNQIGGNQSEMQTM